MDYKCDQADEASEQLDTAYRMIEIASQPKETARPRGTDSAKVIQVIVTEALEGRGSKSDPCVMQKKYWSLDGELLAIGGR